MWDFCEIYWGRSFQKAKFGVVQLSGSISLVLPCRHGTFFCVFFRAVLVRLQGGDAGLKSLGALIQSGYSTQ